MNPVWMISLSMIAAAGSAPAESVTIPWSEFSELYRRQIVSEVKDQFPADDTRDLYVMHDVSLDLQAGEGCLRGTFTCSGKVLEGTGAIPLLGAGTLVRSISAVTGGELTQMEGMTSLHPGGDPSFGATLEILIPLREAGALLEAELDLPPGVRRTLTLRLPESLQPVELPGLQDTDGTIHLPSNQKLLIQLAQRSQDEENTSIALGALTRVALEGRRLVCRTDFLPDRPLYVPVEITLPPTSRLIAAGVPASQVDITGESAYRIRRTPGDQSPFHLTYSLEIPASDATTRLTLPVVAGNQEVDQFLVIDQPASGQIELGSEDEDTPIMPVIPPPSLEAYSPAGLPCLRVPQGRVIDLDITRYTQIDTPPAVLDSVWFFTSFEENGGSLSQLRLEVPMTVGPRMTIEAVPGADIWSLTVNGAPQPIQMGRDGNWIIALDHRGDSRVELAYLTESEAMGLQGRIETTMPGIGLPARRVSLGIGLPRRVDLLSIEGPVSPSGPPDRPVPDTGTGVPHYFSRSYYQGSPLRLSAYYKEPAAGELTTP